MKSLEVSKLDIVVLIEIYSTVNIFPAIEIPFNEKNDYAWDEAEKNLF